MVILKNIDIDIDMYFLENIDFNMDIDKRILQNIDISKYCIDSNLQASEDDSGSDIVIEEIGEVKRSGDEIFPDEQTESSCEEENAKHGFDSDSDVEIEEMRKVKRSGDEIFPDEQTDSSCEEENAKHGFDSDSDVEIEEMRKIEKSGDELSPDEQIDSRGAKHASREMEGGAAVQPRDGSIRGPQKRGSGGVPLTDGRNEGVAVSSNLRAGVQRTKKHYNQHFHVKKMFLQVMKLSSSKIWLKHKPRV